MIKKVIILLIILLIVCGGVIGYAAMNAGKLVKQFKPDLERLASSALSANVSLGDLDVSIFPDAKVHVHQFKISQSDRSKEGLTLNDLVLDISLLPLLSKKLEIVELTLNRPQLVFLKDASGVRIEGLPRPPKKKEKDRGPSSSVTKSADQEPTQKASVPAGLGLNLNKFSILNATVLLKDLNENKEYSLKDLTVKATMALEGQQVTISNLNVNGKALDLADFRVSGKPITYDISKSVAQLQPITIEILKNELVLNGSANLTSQETKVELSSPGLSIESFLPLVASIAPSVKDFRPTGTITPNIQAQVKKNVPQASGSIELKGIGAQIATLSISDLAGSLNIQVEGTSSQHVKSENLSLSIGKAPVTAALSASLTDTKKAAIETFTASAFSGSIKLKSDLLLDASKAFQMVCSLSHINVQEALSASTPYFR